MSVLLLLFLNEIYQQLQSWTDINLVNAPICTCNIANGGMVA